MSLFSRCSRSKGERETFQKINPWDNFQAYESMTNAKLDIKDRDSSVGTFEIGWSRKATL